MTLLSTRGFVAHLFWLRCHRNFSLRHRSSDIREWIFRYVKDYLGICAKNHIIVNVSARIIILFAVAWYNLWLKMFVPIWALITTLSYSYRQANYILKREFSTLSRFHWSFRSCISINRDVIAALVWHVLLRGSLDSELKGLGWRTGWGHSATVFLAGKTLNSLCLSSPRGVNDFQC